MLGAQPRHYLYIEDSKLIAAICITDPVRRTQQQLLRSSALLALKRMVADRRLRKRCSKCCQSLVLTITLASQILPEDKCEYRRGLYRCNGRRWHQRFTCFLAVSDVSLALSMQLILLAQLRIFRLRMIRESLVIIVFWTSR